MGLFILGYILGSCFVLIAMKILTGKMTAGTFNITEIEGENAAIGITFDGEITDNTKTIILKRSR